MSSPPSGSAPYASAVTVLQTPLRVNGATIRNRLYRAPVLEGAGSGEGAAEAYAKHFVENARHGVGLIIQGNSCIFEEGRTSPGMTLVHTRERMLALAPMVEAVHGQGASIFIQIGHGGLYAMEAWHEPYASQRKHPILAVSPLPARVRLAFRGVPIHVMTTDEVRALAVRFGEAAAWAREAGYDGVQLASANAKLLDQFLSPFYNRRTDEFGGSLENRARILRLIREAVAERAGADYPCTVKVPAEVGPPLSPHTGVDDAMRLCQLVEEWGYDAVTPVEVSVFPDTTLSRGGVPRSLWKNPSMKERLRKAAPARRRRWVLMAGYLFGGWRSPFEPVWNRHLFTEASRRVSIPVFAVGGIRTAAEVEEILESGAAAMVGIGRPFYAEADLAARILDDGGHARCENSNLCVPAQMLGMKGICYNPQVRRQIAQKE
jgi:2,4-dienoyl-CoA reductase-like NADH-dependent reductase (Old Yellow Enzyme family)